MKNSKIDEVIVEDFIEHRKVFTITGWTSDGVMTTNKLHGVWRDNSPPNAGGFCMYIYGVAGGLCGLNRNPPPLFVQGLLWGLHKTDEKILRTLTVTISQLLSCCQNSFKPTDLNITFENFYGDKTVRRKKAHAPGGPSPNVTP